MDPTAFRHLQLYEHDRIRVGEQRQGVTFCEKDWHLLLQLNERHYPPYLQPIHRGIRTLNYVGMVQLPGLCLEILPKTDRDEATQNRNLLLAVLDRCRKTPYPKNSISLRRAEGSLSDHFIGQFLEEVEILYRKGLVKKYRKEAANFSRFRGRMMVREHIRQNYVHKERVFAEYQAFDEAHALHHFIGIALRQVIHVNPAPKIKDRAQHLLSYLPENGRHDLNDQRWQNIRLKQQEHHYKAVLQWAGLIMNHLSPVMQRGKLRNTAFLFDMQKLFEEIIAQEISKAAQKNGHCLQVQPSQNFWRQRKIRPDMVLRTQNGEKIILDTKWKLLKNGLPDERDLKQMYIYNRFFNARRGVLIYPAQSGMSAFSERYQHHAEKMCCEVIFAPLTDHSRYQLNPALGQDVLSQILQNKL